MATRNISVQITANVRKYTDGLRRAEKATQRFQTSVQTSGQASQKSNRFHTQLERQGLSGVARGSGMAMASMNKLGHTTRRTGVAMNEAKAAGGGLAGTLTFIKSAAVQALAAFGGYMLINSIIQSVSKAFNFLKDSVMQFDSAMAKSLAIADGVTSSMRAQMEERARAESRISAFNPAEIAEGYYFLVASGLDLKQSMEGVGVAAAFSQAAVMEFEKGAETLVQTQAALGLRTEDATENMLNMTRVADVLVKAATNSTTTVELMADAMRNKFATAMSLANREVEEGAAILMAYAQVGVQGRLAGTQASIWLRDIQKAAINNGQAFEDMGVQVFDSSGMLMNLTGIAKQMSVEFGSMSSKELRMTLKDLGFADRAVHAILPIIATSTEEWEKHERAVGAAGGTSEKVAKKQLKSLENQLKLINQAMSTAAERGGKAALNVLYQAWEKLRQPINDVVENLVKFHEATTLPTVKMLASLLGGALLLALTTVAQTLASMTKILAFLGPALKPLAMMIGLWKAMSLMSGPVAKFFDSMARGWGNVKRRTDEALTSQKEANRSFGRTATMLDRSGGPGKSKMIEHQMTRTQALRSEARAMTGEFRTGFARAQRAGQGFFTSVKAGAARAMSSVKAMNGAIMSGATAAGIFAAAALGAWMAWKQLADSAKEAGKSIAEAAQESHDLSTTQGIIDGNKALRDRGEINKHNLRVLQEQNKGSFKGDPIAAFNRWRFRQLSSATDKAIDEAKRENRERSKALNEGAREVAKKTDATVRQAKERIQEMNLGESIIEGVDSEAGREAFNSVVGSFEGIGDAAKRSGLSVKQMAGMSQEDLAELTEVSDELAESLGEIFAGIVDPGEILSGITAIREEMMRSFGSDVPGVFSSLQDELQQAAEDSAENAFKAHDDSISAQVKALDARKKALDKPELGKGKKSDADNVAHDAAMEQYDREIEAIDRQKDALQDGKKAKDDFSSDPAGINYSNFSQRLLEEGDAAEEYYSTLEQVRVKLQGSGLKASEQDKIITALSALGQDGLPVIQDFAREGGAAFEGMVNFMLGQVERLEPEITADFETFKQQQQEAAAEVDKIGSNMIGLAGALGGTDVTDANIVDFVALGPEAAAMIPELLQRAATDAGEVATVIRNALTAADFGTGSIPDNVMESMAIARAVASGNPQAMIDAVEAGIDPATIAQNLKDHGLEWAAGMMDSMAAEIESNTTQLKLQRAMDSLRPTTGRGGARAGAGAGTGSSAGENRRLKPTHDEFGIPLYGRVAPEANGGIVQFANGGVKENHKAQIARAGEMRLWAEPETGGEAYIPLGGSKRVQATPILAEVARRFGYELTQYANGGIAAAYNPMVGGNQYGPSSSGGVVAVAVPVESKNVTNFNGPIQGVKMEDAMAFAERKKRQKRLAGGKR